MAIIELFSDRQKRLQGDSHDVYIYDRISDKLRGQILFIIDDLNRIISIEYDYCDPDTGGYCSGNESNTYCNLVLTRINRERGYFYNNKDISLFDGPPSMFDYLSSDSSFIDFMDVTEQYLSGFPSRIDCIFDNEYMYTSIDFDKDEMISKYKDLVDELNKRFINAGVGYQFENGQFIRIDNQFIHAEVMKPALSLLNQDMYKPAQDEFLLAHEHYRDENYEDCLKNCANSFESVMKIICHKQGWQHNPSKDGGKALIDVIIKNGLIPDYLSKQFEAILQGIVDLRNKNGGHGRGLTREKPPRYFAEFMLHQTAAVILMLVRAEEAL